jgi:hypothetical protein
MMLPYLSEIPLPSRGSPCILPLRMKYACRFLRLLRGPLHEEIRPSPCLTKTRYESW